MNHFRMEPEPMSQSIDLFSHLRVPKSLVNVDEIKQELHVVNQLGGGDGEGFIDLWEEDGDHLILPRGYTPKLYSRKPVDVRDFRNSLLFKETPERFQWKFKKDLRPHQHEPFAAVAARPGDDRILNLGCGLGKTCIALKLAAIRAKKTLVIVDTEQLMEQWIERICGTKEKGYTDGCLDIKPEDVGRIQKDKVRVGNQITLAMLQTLYRRTYGATLYDQFGLVIFDECHIMGAPMSSKVAPLFPGERLGLSATWHRRDGMTPVFHLHMGGETPCYTDVHQDMSATFMLKNVVQTVSSRKLDYIYSDRFPGHIQLNMFITDALDDPQWRQEIIADLQRFESAGRHILVAGDRREHLTWTHDRLKSMGSDVSLALGKMGGKKQQEALKHKVILGTHQLVGKALDQDSLDTLVLLFPYAPKDGYGNLDTGRIRQAVGRITRYCPGKKAPKVLIYMHPYCDQMARWGVNMQRAIHQFDPNAPIKCINMENKYS